MRVHGLKTVNKTIFFVANLTVTGHGKTIFSQPDLAKSNKPIPSKGFPVGNIKGTIHLPKVPGTYIAHFKIVDRHATRSLDFDQAIVVQP